MITYTINSGERVTLTRQALLTFERYRQSRVGDPEAGGQLFGRIQGGNVEVLDATGPRQMDWRSRFGFRPSRRAERAEIKQMHKVGLHYLGDWHTHPEPVPIASGLDLQSVAETARLSRHTSGPLLLVVVGTKEAPEGLFVCLHDGKRATELQKA